jgi:hypothetical protein
LVDNNTAPLNYDGFNNSGVIADYETRVTGDDIRFVLFLSDDKFFKGAFALVESLWESRNSTLLPPLVMVVGKQYHPTCQENQCWSP